MPLKPSILKGMETILGAKKVESFVNDKEDYLIIEDDSGRMRINNNEESKFHPSNFISGIIAAVYGHLEDKGVFVIEDLCYYTGNYSMNPRLKTSVITNDDNAFTNILNSSNNIVAFVSGLSFGSDDLDGRLKLARNMLVNFIQGKLVHDEKLDNLVKRINRLIIAGNVICSPENAELVEKGSFLKLDLNQRVYKMLLQNYNEADKYMTLLSHSVKVDLMPGAEDNSCSFFPQTPLSNILFQQSTEKDGLNLVTNPYRFFYEDLFYIGTSGQNIENIQKYSRISNNPIDLMEKTLEWGHLAPSAPDTLRTYPYSDRDPLIMTDMSNIYFSGNQNQFDTKLTYYKDLPLRVISIPGFTKTHSIVLMDTSTLQACEYKFDFINN